MAWPGSLGAALQAWPARGRRSGPGKCGAGEGADPGAGSDAGAGSGAGAKGHISLLLVKVRI